MIKITVYKNGYKIEGHSWESTCLQVSLWHWVASNILLNFDTRANTEEYTSSRDNKENPMQGLSWVKFTPTDNNLKWLFDDLVISMERWAKEQIKNGEVTFEHKENEEFVL